MKTIIIGGGHIGQLAGWLMPHATVLDWRRPPAVGDRHRPRRYGAMYLHEPLEGLPCRPVTIRTTIDGAVATISAARDYKAKVGKSDDLLREHHWHKQFIEYTAGWELESFPDVEVQWGAIVTEIHLDRQQVYVKGGEILDWDRIISTIPLFSLMEMLGIPCPTPLQHAPIAVRTAPRPLDLPAMTTDIHVNYVSDPGIPVYRTTDRGSQRDNEWLYEANRSMGVAMKVLRPGKIYPESWVPSMVAELNRMGVYPVGRAGRWASDELTHDSYKDLLRWAQDMRA